MLTKIHDNVLLSSVSNECKHNILFVSKVTLVNKIHTQSCKRNASKVKVHSSNLNNKAPERLQHCSGASSLFCSCSGSLSHMIFIPTILVGPILYLPISLNYMEGAQSLLALCTHGIIYRN